MTRFHQKNSKSIIESYPKALRSCLHFRKKEQFHIIQKKKLKCCPKFWLNCGRSTPYRLYSWCRRRACLAARRRCRARLADVDKPQTGEQLGRAIIQKVKVVGTIVQDVWAEDSRIRVMSVVVKYLVVPVLLGISPINTYFKATYPVKTR